MLRVWKKVKRYKKVFIYASNSLDKECVLYYSLGQLANINMTLILLVATICASYAFMLPIATPPNAIAMSSGAVKVKEMAKFGFIINILAILIVIIVVLVY